MSTLRTETLQTTDSAYSVKVADLATLPPTTASFGVTGDGVTDDTANLNSFLNSVDVGTIPPGTYRITGTLNFRSGQTITGAGPSTIINYDATAPAANTPVLSMVGLNDTVVRGFTLNVDPDVYPSARCLYQSGSTDCVFENINVPLAGGNVSYTTGSTRCHIRNVEGGVYKNNGFYINGGKFNVIDTCRAPDGSTGFMGAQLVTGFGNVVKDGYFAKMPDNYFGIHSYACNFADIYGNVVENTRREAIAVGGSCFGPRIHDNTMSWTENLGVGDFGMSLAGDDVNNIVADFQVYGNTIKGSAFDGIGVAGWTSRGIVHNNTIRDCAQQGASGHQSGIKLYGWITGAIVDGVQVYDNLIAKVSGGNMLYGVTEVNGLGVASSNTIRDNTTLGLGTALTLFTTQGSNSVVSLNRNDLDGKVHNAVPTPTSGTITSATGNIVFQVVGKLVYCIATMNIANNGTGAGALNMTLPFNALGGVLSGDAAGKGCKAGLNGGMNGIVITNYDGTYPGASGANIVLSGILRIA